MQRIAEGYVRDEIASPTLLEHALHGRARDLAHARLEFSEIGRHEPALRQRAIFRMIRRIHLHQRTHQVRPARDLADALFHRPVRQRGRAVGIVKQLVLPADGLDIGMLCHYPERIEAVRLGKPERIVGAEPAVAVVDAMVGIGGRIDERGGNVGNVDVGTGVDSRIHGPSPLACVICAMRTDDHDTQAIVGPEACVERLLEASHSGQRVALNYGAQCAPRISDSRCAIAHLRLDAPHRPGMAADGIQ